MTKKTFTHLDKVFWPKEGYTKGDLINYYDKLAATILPYLKNRPLALNRYPQGIRGVHFFQKNVAGKLPAFVDTITIRAKTTGKPVRYVMCNNKQTLLYVINIGCIELHPWSSKKNALNKPGYMIFDLDPGPKTSFDDAVAVAQTLHKILDAARIPNFCKTSGKRGLHVYVPLKGTYSYEKVREIAKPIAEAVVKKIPRVATLEHWPKKRKDKVYLDLMRNAVGQTTVAPYSLRPAPGATVSTPLEWREVKAGLDPARFTIKTIFKRLKKKGDVWKPVSR